VRKQVEDHLLVECAKARGEAGIGYAASSADRGDRFDAQVEALQAVGLLDGAEVRDWRARVRAPPEPAVATIDDALRVRVESYLESLFVPDDDEALARLTSAVGVLQGLGVLTEEEAEDWWERMMDLDADEGEDWVELCGGEIRRVLLAPDEEANGFRPVSVELYDDAVILRWTLLGGAPFLVDLTLADDVGTRYESRGGGATGGDFGAREELARRRSRGHDTFTPAVPVAATQLVVERAGHRFEIALRP
jgi:hypothetical protein